MIATLRDTPKERVKLYQPQALADLLPAAQESGFLKDSRKPQSAPATSTARDTDHDELAQRKAAQRAARAAELREKEEKFKQEMEWKRRAEVDKKEAKFQGMYQQVLDGLDYSTGITGEAADVLARHSKTKLTKKRELHNEWQEQVFDRLQDRISSALSQRSAKSIEARLNAQYSDYLHTTNTKAAVFRDVIIEADYDPLAVHRHTIRVPTSDIFDPVKRDLIKAQQERMAGTWAANGAAPEGPQTRYVLDTQRWGALQIRATPYGHCVAPDGTYEIKPCSERLAKLRESHIPQDHYGYVVGREAVDAEMPQGKRTVDGPDKRRGRDGLFDVMQHTTAQQPEVTGGDSWLEYRGRRSVPGPEQTRGRSGLYEVVQQSSNPYQDGRSLGDEWLEARGKQRVADPSAKRGRPDLFETLQQRSNPYIDHRTLGDEWLERRGKQVLSSNPHDHKIQEIIQNEAIEPLPPHQPRFRRDAVSNLGPLDGSLTVKV